MCKSKSCSDISYKSALIVDYNELKEFSKQFKLKTSVKCTGVNGCGTPTGSTSTSTSISDDLQEIFDIERTNDFGKLRTSFSAVPALSSHPLPPISSQSLLDTAQYLSGRRGSAPGGIGVYTNSELAAAAAIVFLHGAVASQHQTRRSSFPVERTNGVLINSSNTNNHKYYCGAKFNCPHFGSKVKGRSLEVLMTSLSAKNKLLTRQACSLDSGAEFKQWLLNSKPRRGSVPQEILIESLTNYISNDGL
ncbi:hypothetical protein B4U80_09657 [Leptotrombidium deliense]|uniref:Uncharacterized protein n=1 Tax=Leptotrombidium deliense TaxID=299467 RepID=A0A443SFC9_9ACAR|nr:hypothetical protein B4U80_09657 [Leptotrombidium deliense]